MILWTPLIYFMSSLFPKRWRKKHGMDLPAALPCSAGKPYCLMKRVLRSVQRWIVSGRRRLIQSMEPPITS